MRKIIVTLALLAAIGGSASYPYQAGSCSPYADYRSYRGPYCSPAS